MLDTLAGWLSFDLLRFVPDTHLGQSVHYFVYENAKIFILLILMTHLMGLLRFYLPVEKMRMFLTSRHFYGFDYFFSSLFGAITPFCSCSSIPLFISFMQARIPMGLTFAFLITSPLINEVALVLFLSEFGLRVTLLYAGMGILIGMFGGFLIGKMKMESEISLGVEEPKQCSCKCKEQRRDIATAMKSASKEARSITRRVMPFVLLGVGIGAFLHGYVPSGYFESMLEGSSLWGVPLAVVLAVPLYANASAVIPIAAVLVEKGVAIGVALAFMMAVVGLSLPEAFILKRVMSWKLLGAFFGIVTVGIIIVGYVFSAVA